MKTIPLLRTTAAAWRSLFVALTLTVAAPVRPAETMPTGTIEGRVANDSGTYLGNARINAGAAFETFTDPFGHFRLTGVPVGMVRLRVFYTGFPAQERTVTIAAGQRSTQNFVLTATGKGDFDLPVELDAFVVEASRDMTAAALAVNEQRFAQSIKTVMSTDTVGDIADGNVGEFVKFLPGISLGFSGGHAASISVGGLPPESTPIMIDGNRVASATAETRQVQLDQISINNMARVEVIRSQNPDNPASGTVAR